MRGGRLARAVLSSAALRRLQGAAFVGILSGTAYAVALSVYAFRHGGTAAVGLVGLLVMVPAGVLAPVAALAADRRDRATVIAAALLVRAFVLCAAAEVIHVGGPPAAVYALAVIGSVLARIIYPAQAALLPDVARSAETLAAANVVASTLESLGSVLGPAVGGILVAVWAPDVAFLVCGLPLLAAAASVLPLRGVHGQPAGESVGAFWREATVGIEMVVRNRPMRLLVGCFTLQTLTFGVFTVLMVPVGIDLVHGGNGAVGLINACFGAGGVAGGVALLALGQRELGLQTACGLALWGAPIGLMAAWPREAPIVFLAAVIGFGNTILDAGVFTLLQALAPTGVRARVFGAIEGLAVAAIGVGAVLAPAMVATLGLPGALVASGVPLPVLALIALPSLRALKVDEEAKPVSPHVLAALTRVPFVRILSADAQTRLACAAHPVALPALTTVFRQGDPGDDLYVIDDGEVAISIDGALVTTLGPGDFFGEIALLMGTPRTGTARTTAETTLLRIAGDTFVEVLRGDRATRTSLGAVAARRLARIA